MDIQQLKTFLEVCQTRHFGHAAQNLFLTQSAVSFRIRQLETQLGTELFVRHRNNLQLTPAGERLKVHAHTILATWQRARQEVVDLDLRHQTLSLAASASVWGAWLDKVLGELHRHCPELYWHAETLTGDQMSRRLLERTLDLAVMTDPPKVDDLKTVVLNPLTLVLAAPVGVAIEQALNQAYVLVDWGPQFLLEHAQRLDPVPSPVLQTGDARLAMTFAQQHQGCAFLPESLVNAQPDAWQRFEDYGKMRKSLYLVHHANPSMPSTLKPVIDYLIDG